ncbi:MAG: hypothetical protein WA417_10270 [Stellaceae bacterium]
MPVPDVVKKHLRLPSRIALLLGLGALSVAGARADTAEPAPQAGAEPVVAGDVTVRAEAGRIFLSESGRETELRLGATTQRDHLLRLLEKHGAEGIKLDADPRLIMSGGGGSGFSLRDITKSFTDKPEPAAKSAPPASTPRSAPKQETGPHDHGSAADRKG